MSTPRPSPIDPAYEGPDYSGAMARAASVASLAERDRSAVARAATTLDAARSTLARAQEVSALLAALVDRRRAEVRFRLESVVTHALRSVFGDARSFSLESVVRRGQVDLVPTITMPDGVSRTIPEVGGGVVDVVAVALRVAIVRMVRPAARPVIVLDEPAKHLSGDLVPAFASLLRELSDQLDLQIIVVSHEPELADVSDLVVRVSRGADGASVAATSHGGTS